MSKDTIINKPPRLIWWIVSVCIFSALLVLTNPNNLSQLFGKVLAPCAGGVIGALLFDTLVPYLKPSARLAEPWHLCMIFKPGESDFKVVPGKELEFLVCAALKVLTIVACVLAVALGN